MDEVQLTVGEEEPDERWGDEPSQGDEIHNGVDNGARESEERRQVGQEDRDIAGEVVDGTVVVVFHSREVRMGSKRMVVVAVVVVLLGGSFLAAVARKQPNERLLRSVVFLR